MSRKAGRDDMNLLNMMVQFVAERGDLALIYYRVIEFARCAIVFSLKYSFNRIMVLCGI